MDSDRERLEEGSGVERDMVRQFVTPYRWMVYPLLECALEVRERLGTAPEPHLLAEVVSAFSADATLTTRDANLEGHAVTDAEARDLRPNGNDDT
jgi:hypothetical protein